MKQNIKSIDKVFTVWDYDSQTVTRYLRQGECNCCGLCCIRTIRFSAVNADHPQQKGQDGLLTFSDGKWLEVGEGNEREFYKMEEHQVGEERCIHLGEDNLCDAYERRLPICRIWPSSPADLAHIPECSYHFILLDHRRFQDLGPDSQ